MKHLTFIYALMIFAIVGCDTGDSPLCTDNYCLTGEIFSKDDLEEGQPSTQLPDTVDEAQILKLFAGKVSAETDEKPTDTQPTFGDLRTLYGEVTHIDWDHTDDGDWVIKKVEVVTLDSEKYTITLDPVVSIVDVSLDNIIVVQLASDLIDGITEYEGKIIRNITEHLTWI